MYIYDSVQKTKLILEPIKAGEVSMYVCGPTVYDDAHLGHARSSLSFDMLHRTLKANGYKVTYIRNFTDIDDKIIAKMKDTGKTLKDITEFYTKRYNDEMDALGVQRPTITPKATESIEAMEGMIIRLMQKGFAYQISNGDVYFDTTKDEQYGTLSHMVNDETISRIENISEKKNSKDFALWKAIHDDTVSFESKLGSGRPGWHIECSAMIEKYSNGTDEYSIDIHGGGADLLFPHHENEASQSRCSSGHELAKYWMHNGFVQVDGEKMSKSLGNSFFLRDALSVYDGEVLRFYLTSVHYRNDFNFNEIDLLSAKKRLDRIYRLKKRVFDSKSETPNKLFTKKLLDAMSDDLNISIALSVIDNMMNQANESLDITPNDKNLKREIMANIEYISTLLGFGDKEPFAYFQLGIDEALKAKINELIEQRSEAKKVKNFIKADSIREELSQLDINIMDTSGGTFWERIS